MSSFNTNLNSFVVELWTENSKTDQNCTFKHDLGFTCTLNNHEIALHSASIPNEIPNITRTFDNNVFYYKNWNGDLRVVDLLPTGVNAGIFTIEQINDALETAMKNNKDYLLDADGNEIYYLTVQANDLYNLFQITVETIPTSLPSGWSYPTLATSPYGIYPPAQLSGSSTNMQFIVGGLTSPSLSELNNLPDLIYNYDGIHFSPRPELYGKGLGFVSLLGFNSGAYPSTQTVSLSVYEKLSDKTPIIAPVSSITITCNWASSSDFTQIHQFLTKIPIDVVAHAFINFEPSNPKWIYIPTGSYNTIIVTICDQNGNPITNFLDNSQSFTLTIRKRQS